MKKSNPVWGSIRSMQKSLFLFVLVLFLIGIVFGAIVVNTLDSGQKKDLMQYLQYFFQGLMQENIADSSVAFQHSLVDHLKTMGLLWILGLSVIGMPIILLFLFFKGLVLGFTIGFLVQQMGWKGIGFVMVSVIPPNLFLVPVWILISVAGIHFSITLIRNRFLQHRGKIYPQFVSFSLLATSLSLVLMVAALLEAYLSPWLMRGTIPSSILG